VIRSLEEFAEAAAVELAALGVVLVFQVAFDSIFILSVLIASLRFLQETF